MASQTRQPNTMHCSSPANRNVAQVSNRFPTCRIAGLPACGSCGPSHALEDSEACRLEIGDTAGWKPVGNLRYDLCFALFTNLLVRYFLRLMVPCFCMVVQFTDRRRSWLSGLFWFALVLCLQGTLSLVSN